ncbi:MAG TPA: hypothetical protein VJS92_14650, partial [Candidatus Polarisedimenticolaceae bacterium]|nr:hypothetical protein [Candidatus Polarisedimenticolaceae bacterium]
MSIVRRRALVPAAIVAVALVLVLYVRLRLAPMPLERDEGEFAYQGQLLLEGVPPYAAAYSMKPPGIYAAYALLLAIGGASARGVHLGLLAVNLATILLVYLLGQHLIDAWAGAGAAASYALLSLSPALLGLAGHATHFVALGASGGALLLLVGLERERGS